MLAVKSTSQTMNTNTSYAKSNVLFTVDVEARFLYIYLFIYI